MLRRLLFLLACLALQAATSAQAAPDAALVRQLADDDNSRKVEAIRQLTQTADPDSARILKAMADDSLYLAGDKVLIIDGDQAFDAATGQPVKAPESPDSLTINNRIRGELANALAALKLFDPDRSVRLESATKLQSKVDPEMAPLLARALDKEGDAEIKAMLTLDVPGGQ